MYIPKAHEIYKHFKGNLYQIVAVAEHSETGEQLVIYQALYGDFKIYARPLAMFVSRVDKEKYPQVTQEYRFELQGGERERTDSKDGMPEAETIYGAETMPAAETMPGAENVPVEPDSSKAEELQLDPMLLEFLDADSYETRLNILAGVHHRITEDMLTTMAMACDVEVGDGDLEERYEALKGSLLMLEKYECNRLR